MDARQIQTLMPWRAPFVMVDRMLECVPHRSILTEKSITAGDPLVNRDPRSGAWLPGMLLLEGMSQSAALLFRLSYAEHTPPALPMLGFLQATLHGSAAAGERVRFEVRSVKMTRGGGVFQARAVVEQRLIAEAELAFAAAEGTAQPQGDAS